MKPDQVIDLFRDTDALLDGHFVYTSGRHGNQFLQAARVLQYPWYTEALCTAMAERFAQDRVDLVVGPATGGIVLAYETARTLGCRAAFTEKDAAPTSDAPGNGASGMALRRGFRLEPGTRVLVVEDITTTGGSVLKSIRHLRGRQAEVVGVAVLIDRSGGAVQFDCRFEPLAVLAMQSWPADACALCANGIPVVDPDTLKA